MINVDSLIKKSDTDNTAAILYAAQYDDVKFSNSDYLFNGEIQIKANQRFDFGGARLRHTDSSKVMFTANQVDGWSFVGDPTLQGTLIARGSANEKGLLVIGCNRYLVSGLTAQLFLGIGVYIQPGIMSRYKSDQGNWERLSVYENMMGLQVDAGTGAEYDTFTNFKAIGNIYSAQIAAGNTQFTGGSINENDYGPFLVGGSNNSHGFMTGMNINHNTFDSLRADGVSYGYTLTGCHIYGGGANGGYVRFMNGSTNVCFNGGIIDAPVIHDSVGTNRIIGMQRDPNFSVGGTNPAGFIQVNTY